MTRAHWLSLVTFTGLSLHASLANAACNGSGAAWSCAAGSSGDEVQSALDAASDGAVLEFQNDTMTVGDRIPGGYVFVDGTGVGDIGPSVMRERESLAESGMVVVNLRVGAGGGLVGKPEIISRGFVFVKDEAEMFEAAQAQIAKVAGRAAGDGDLRQRVEAELSDFFYAETKRRPMIFALVNPVG